MDYNKLYTSKLQMYTHARAKVQQDFNKLQYEGNVILGQKWHAGYPSQCIACRYFIALFYQHLLNLDNFTCFSDVVGPAITTGLTIGFSTELATIKSE